MGQVQRHRFHKAPLLTTEQGTVELYGMNYQYDIGDRLSAINSVSSAQYGTEKFAARYHYNEVSQLWKAEYYNPTVSSYSNFEHRYQMIYNYDSLNRLKETYYQSHKDYNAWNSSQGYEYGNAYQEQLAYDANGNVLGLKRTDKTGYMVDHLSLTYKSGTNQLMSVSDAAGANKLQGWDAGSSTNQYDLNGNIISGDGATNIVYDVRNLPIRMQKGGQTIIYRYNAAGQRIYKKVIGTTITEEHYVMNGSELVAVLKNGVVDYWKTSYGRYERSSGTFRAKYYITDHLGSTRVVLDESGQRVEAYDYYAFGLVMPGRGFGNTTKEKFTGKERDIETGWDYFGARYYNPAIARWMNVDPLADKYPSWSPYNYVANNPLSVIDRDGMEGEPIDGELKRDGNTVTLTVNLYYDKSAFLLQGTGGNYDANSPLEMAISELKQDFEAVSGLYELTTGIKLNFIANFTLIQSENPEVDAENDPIGSFIRPYTTEEEAQTVALADANPSNGGIRVNLSLLAYQTESNSIYAIKHEIMHSLGLSDRVDKTRKYAVDASFFVHSYIKGDLMSYDYTNRSAVKPFVRVWGYSGLAESQGVTMLNKGFDETAPLPPSLWNAHDWKFSPNLIIYNPKVQRP